MTWPTLEPTRPARCSAGPNRQALATRSAPGDTPRQAGGCGTVPIPPTVLRILVVDDNQDAAECFALLLQLGGHTSRVAHTGEQAIPMAESFLPDVAFLDIGLPGMDGYELAQALRRRLGPSVLLVALTGWGGDEVRRLALSRGFDLHLTKPADPQVIDRLLAQRTRLPDR